MIKQIPEERRFITKEFAATLAGKSTSYNFRLHDPVQKMLADRSASIRNQSLPPYQYKTGNVTPVGASNYVFARNLMARQPVRP